MFERFTDSARQIVVKAQDAATELNHDVLGSEHLLLALASAGNRPVTAALGSLGVSQDAVMAKILELRPRGEAGAAGHIPFTRNAKHVLELSLKIAIQLGQYYILPEHMALAFIALGEGNAVEVLRALGVLGTLRVAVVCTMIEQGGENIRPRGPLFEGMSADDAASIFEVNDRRVA